MKKLFNVLFILLFPLVVLAQTGTIKGTIKDAITQEAIIGASIVIEGTSTGASTDIEGSFTIPKVNAGVHTLLVTYISYKNKRIENIRVEAGKSTVVNTILEEDAKNLTEVVVRAQRVTNTDISVITEIKQAEQVAVGVSSEQITKSQDRDAAQTIRRVPGISINDDRFVMVRGLSERYNAVMINDVLTPSSEVDVKAFSFDVIPSSSIDRLLVFKSGAGDLPGEFAGGVIKIYTKNIPDKNSFNFGLSTSYRSGTTFNDFSQYKGGKTDFLGFDDGSRALPSGFPSMIPGGTPSEANLQQFRQLPTYYNLNTSPAIPDLRMSLGLTRRFDVGNTTITNITAINYTNTKLSFNSNRYRYAAFNDVNQKSDLVYQYNDNENSQNVRIGILHNWAFLLSPTTKIEFRNLFNQMGGSETVVRNGALLGGADQDIKSYAFRYESRSIYSGQLAGTHELSDFTTVKWVGALAYTHRAEPDYRRFITSRQIGTEIPYQVDIPQFANLVNAARYNSNLNETILTASGNIEHRINKGEEADEKQIKLRAGFYLERKDRDFQARWFSYVRGSNQFDESLRSLPLDQVFAPANINTNTGFTIAEGTNFDDKYDASNLLAAGYASAYIPFSDKLNASVGVRLEYNRQQLNSGLRGSGLPVKVDNPVTRVLPSLNMSYNLTERALVRLAYSMTLNRPEFRELAPFTYYDFNFDVNITGNSELKTPSIHNLDARYEFYPTKSELISFGVFYKRFINPIEYQIRFAGSGVGFSFINAPHSTSLGAELEVRKSLATLSESKFLQNLNLILNASIINSKVELGDLASSGQDKNRPMQGQSPYLVNAGLYYNDVDHQFQVNVLYNVIGQRIFRVGDAVNPTIYEMPRNVIDLNVTKGIGEHFEIKGGIQDILNQKFRFIQDSNTNAKISGTDEPIYNFRRGSYTTIGINYKF